MEITSLQKKRKEYYEKNKQYILKKSAEYYTLNKEKVLKRISKLHKENPIPGRERAKKFAENNPEKVKTYQLNWKQRNPEKRKIYTRNSRIRAYGIEPKEYYDMLEKQGHGCAICSANTTNRAMSIDHDHKTGKVRGLLCDGCNMSLGHIEREDWLKKAKKYLAKYK